MKPHTVPPTDVSETEEEDFECELACGTGVEERGVAHELMRSWVGTITAAMPPVQTAPEPRAGRFGSGYSVAALHARIEELVRENLALRAELVRRVQIETDLRNAKRRARSVRSAHALGAPGHDLVVAAQSKLRTRA